jgi:hypothetical protein
MNCGERGSFFALGRRRLLGQTFAIAWLARRVTGKDKLNLQSQVYEEVGCMPLWLVAFLTGVAFTVVVTSVGGGK